jgi:signal transduction histidine kinase
MDDNAILFRRHLPFGAAAFMAFYAWDYLLSSEVAQTTLYIRLGVFAYYVLVYIASWQSWFPRHHDLLLLIGIVLTGVGIAWILLVLPNGFVLGIAGIGVTIMAVSGFFWLPPAYMIASCTLITGSAIALMMVAEVPRVVLISNSAFLVAFSWYGSVTNWRHELYSRTLIAEKLRSDALVQEVSSLRQERMSWLENLARFLRHELKNQVVAVGTSLDLLERAKPDAAPERYVGRARKSLGRMDRLLRSATEATSLEAALGAEARDAVDLSAMVAERVSALQHAHPRQEFRTSIEPDIQLEGNEDRLAQLVDKLLDNAAEHSVESKDILVSLTRTPSRTLLVIENEGDSLPTDKEALFDPFVTAGKSHKDAGNVGLGLFVAKVITEAHGGTIEAQDLTTSQGARFEVRFPTLRAPRPAV